MISLISIRRIAGPILGLELGEARVYFEHKFKESVILPSDDVQSSKDESYIVCRNPLPVKCLKVIEKTKIVCT
jgi:hypothetical protein